jgi:Spy/CpxP family protein refolding chaperone
LLGDLREARIALAAQLAVPEPDPAAATATLRPVQDVEANLFEARLAARREAMGVLTAEQRSRLAAPPQRRSEAAAGSGRDRATSAGKDDADDDEDEDEDEEDPHAAHR